MSEKKEQKFFFGDKEVTKEAYIKLSRFDSWPKEVKREKK